MKRVNFNLPRLLITILLLSGVVGCGSAGDGYSGARGQVTGKVTLNSQPLKSGCQVIFMSTKGGYTASGVVVEGGQYTLTYSDSSGLPVGEYEVQLTAPIASNSTQDVDPSKMAMNMKLGRKNTAEDSGPFPAKYGSTSTSKMSFPVKEGPNTADFTLSK